MLAAIADAIHNSNTWKGKGKGKGKDGNSGGKAGSELPLAGRNCTQCGDYNFEHRYLCRRCGAVLPLPAWSGKGAPPANEGKGTTGKGAWGWYKGTAGQKASGGDGGGTGKADGGDSPSQAQPPAPAAGNEGTEGTKDPSERVKEIRSEEERLRKARAQFLDVNPRMVAVIDDELANLGTEREQLQPLEINLQAAAGRTANARASLAKARERKDAAAKELRAKLDAYHAAEKEVKEAEEKLRATEAAATARRSEAKIHGVQDAVEFLQQAATEKVADKGVASEVAAALQKIAQLLRCIDANVDSSGKEGGGTSGAGTTNAVPASDAGPAGENKTVGIVPVQGSSSSKKLLLEKPPLQPGASPVPAATDGAGNGHGGKGNGGAAAAAGGDGPTMYAGGAVDGEIVMGATAEGVRDGSDDLVAQAAAALGEDTEL